LDLFDAQTGLRPGWRRDDAGIADSVGASFSLGLNAAHGLNRMRDRGQADVIEPGQRQLQPRVDQGPVVGVPMVRDQISDTAGATA
jgi:hypothetical protein